MTLPTAPGRVMGTFSVGARRALPPMLPPADELPEGDLRAAIAEVEAIWSRLHPLQEEGTALFKQRKVLHREDEQRHQQAAAGAMRLPASTLAEADARLDELADQVRALRDAYAAAKQRLASVDAQAWQQVAGVFREQVKADQQAVTSAVVGLRDALEDLRRSSGRQRWAAAHGRHNGWMPAPVLDGGRAVSLVLDELAALADRLAAPPPVLPDPEMRAPQDLRRSRRASAATT